LSDGVLVRVRQYKEAERLDPRECGWVCLSAFTTKTNVVAFSGGIALAAQVTLPIPTVFSVAWSVCLSSVVCHIRAPCLNRSTDIDAIWQEHLWGPMTHCV